MRADRAVPPARIDMAHVRAQLREREAAEERERQWQQALRVETEVREAALHPADGWWRKGRTYGGAPLLRKKAVIDAIAVGCSIAQIAKAAGVSHNAVYVAASYAREHPTCEQDDLDWEAIIKKAIAARKSIHEVAEERQVSASLVSHYARKFDLHFVRIDYWTEEQVTILRRDFSGEDLSILSERLGKTVCALKCKAWALGLRRSRA